MKVQRSLFIVSLLVSKHICAENNKEDTIPTEDQLLTHSKTQKTFENANNRTSQDEQYVTELKDKLEILSNKINNTSVMTKGLDYKDEVTKKHKHHLEHVSLFLWCNFIKDVIVGLDKNLQEVYKVFKNYQNLICRVAFAYIEGEAYFYNWVEKTNEHLTLYSLYFLEILEKKDRKDAYYFLNTFFLLTELELNKYVENEVSFHDLAIKKIKRS